MTAHSKVSPCVIKSRVAPEPVLDAVSCNTPRVALTTLTTPAWKADLGKEIIVHKILVS